MKIKTLFVIAFTLFFPFFAQTQEITQNKFGNGLINVVAADSSFSLKFAARFQSLYIGQWDYSPDGQIDNGESSFLIRRSRLKFDGFAYSPKLRYKFEIGLSNRDISGASKYTHNSPRYVMDAVVMWNFHDNFELWVGQTKLPGNRERVISSANMETVDRSLVNSRFNIDRDMGLQLHHFMVFGKEFIIREIIAFSQGEGRNVTTGNEGGFQYTARAEILPFGEFADYTGADLKREPTPKLAIGGSYDYNDNAVRTRSNSGTYMDTDTGLFETDIQTFFLDAMFKYRGWSFMGEYATRKAENPIAVNTDGTPTGDIVNVGEGFNLQTGYLFNNNVQVIGRYTEVQPDEEFFEMGLEKQYTLGLSKYFVGHKLKIQTDISFNDFENDNQNSLMYRLQFDLHF